MPPLHAASGVGYGTYVCGKWHLCPMADMTAAGRFDHWPLSHGFDRFYGWRLRRARYFIFGGGEIRGQLFCNIPPG